MHNIIVRSLQVTQNRFSMDVSTRDNISYGTAMIPPNHPKGDEINKEGGSDSSKAATSSCERCCRLKKSSGKA